MNPWENDTPVSEAPWLKDEEAQKRFTYQPPFTEKSWWQRAREDFARDQPVRGKSFFEGWKEGIAAQTTPLREAREETEQLQHEAEKDNPLALVMGPKERGLSERLALGFTGEAAGSSLKAFVAGRGAKAAPATAAQLANEAGYVLPPAMATEKPGTLAAMAESLGGEIKTAQRASVKNQTVTNKLAAQSLGLPEGTMLTDEIFNSVRGKAAQAYKAVEDSGIPIKQDMAFLDDLLALGPQSEEMAKFFPKTAKNDLIKELQDEFGTGAPFSPKAGIQAVRRLRYKATSNLKNFADPEKAELGKAQRGAAEAIDDLIERNLSSAGKPSLMEAYRSARQLIAKSHDVEAATNTATGNVNAHDVAKLADKGRPLTGELKLIADTASTFPKALQSPEKFGGAKRWSALDAVAALAATHGHPGLLMGVLARPGARELALSRIMQNRLAGPPRIAPPNSLMSIMRPVQPMVPTFNAPPP